VQVTTKLFYKEPDSKYIRLYMGHSQSLWQLFSSAIMAQMWYFLNLAHLIQHDDIQFYPFSYKLHNFLWISFKK
jgi:hypothetical protein